MKISTSFLLVFSICFWWGCRAQSINSHIKILELRNNQISNIVSDMYDINREYYNWDKTVFIFNFIKAGNEYDLRISPLSKTELNWLIKEMKKTAYGYFESNGIPILVFGNADIFFSQTDRVKTINWLKTLPPPPDNGIDLPPWNFEPSIWRYKFTDGEFKSDKNIHVTIFD